MGKHTAYWEQYARSQAIGALRILGALLGWMLVIALIAIWHERVGGLFPWLMGIAFIGLVLTLAWLGTKAQKVVCPECGTSYTRAKIGGQCPSCGLRLLQHDP